MWRALRVGAVVAAGTGTCIDLTANDGRTFRSSMRFGRATWVCFQTILDYRAVRAEIEKVMEDEQHSTPPSSSKDGVRPKQLRRHPLMEPFYARLAQRIIRLSELHGGVTTKLGQYVATMNHVMPKALTDPLASLHDQAKSLPLREVKSLLQVELGVDDLSQCFSSLSAEPIAAASLAQVHKGVRKEDGAAVAVKVQHPGLRSSIEADLWTLRVLARAVAWGFPEFAYEWIVPEFEVTIRQELDFNQELRNLNRAKTLFESRKDVYVVSLRVRFLLADFRRACIPSIANANLAHAVLFLLFPRLPSVKHSYRSRLLSNTFYDCCPHMDTDEPACAQHARLSTIPQPWADPKLSSRRVLTMEFIEGCKLDQPDKIKALGLRPSKVASTLVSVFGEMIFVHGFIHVDPHPGNLLVRANPRIGRGQGQSQQVQLVLLDHGMYRRLTPQFRRQHCRLWKALVLRDHKLAQQTIRLWGLPKEAYDALSLILTLRAPGSTARLGQRVSAEDRKNLAAQFKGRTAADVNEFLESLPRDVRTSSAALETAANYLCPRFRPRLPASKVPTFDLPSVHIHQAIPHHQLLATIHSFFDHRFPPSACTTLTIVRSINKTLGGTTPERLRALGQAAIAGMTLEGVTKTATDGFMSRMIVSRAASDERPDEEDDRSSTRDELPSVESQIISINQVIDSERHGTLPFTSAVRLWFDIAAVRFRLWAADNVMAFTWWWLGLTRNHTEDVG